MTGVADRIPTAIIVVAFFCAAVEARAKNAYGYSSLSVTASGIYSTSMTDLDYVAQAYYSVETDGYLWAGSSIGASGSAYSDGAYVDLYVPTAINTAYWIQTNHWVVPITGGNVPNFSCVTPEWYQGSFGVSACGTTTSPTSVYIGTSYADGNTEGSPPSITSVDQTTYGTAQAGTSGYVILYGSNLASPYGSTSVSIGDGISASVTYAGQSQVNVYYSIPANAAIGGQALSLSTPYGTTSATFYVYPMPAPLSIITTSLPAATEGASYSPELSASGGYPPYTWSESGLPAGLTLSSTGILGGYPTVAGTLAFTAQVTDSRGATATQSLTIAVAGFTLGPLTSGAVSLAVDSAISAIINVNVLDNFPYTGQLSFAGSGCGGGLGISAYYVDGTGVVAQISAGTGVAIGSWSCVLTAAYASVAVSFPFPVTVTPPPPTLQITSAGAPIPAGQCAHITTVPQMPNLAFTLVPATGTTLTGTVTWALSAEYIRSDATVDLTVWSPSSPLPVTSTWTPQFQTS